MRQRQVTTERLVRGGPVVRHKHCLRLHSTGESTFCQCTALCRPRLSFTPSGILAPTALVSSQIVQTARCGITPEPDTATNTIEGWSLRDETLARVDDNACRHSPVTDTRCSRSCDNGQRRETHSSFFSDMRSSTGVQLERSGTGQEGNLLQKGMEEQRSSKVPFSSSVAAPSG